MPQYQHVWLSADLHLCCDVSGGICSGEIPDLKLFQKCRNNVHFEYKTSLLIQLNLVYLLALYLLARTKQRANFFLMC